MLFGKNEREPDAFWQEYEEKTGEKVLARSLGQYLSGWEEFDNRRWTNMWGLIIASSGGFRFHHFPQQGWLEAFTQFTGSGASREKTIFIPKEQIRTARLVEESRWWKKIFAPSSPKLVINYQDETGTECQLLLETDSRFGDVAEKLNAIAKTEAQ